MDYMPASPYSDGTINGPQGFYTIETLHLMIFFKRTWHSDEPMLVILKIQQMEPQDKYLHAAGPGTLFKVNKIRDSVPNTTDGDYVEINEYCPTSIYW